MTISPHLLEITEETEKNETDESSKQVVKDVELGTLDLLKHPGCRNATLIMFVVWTSVTLGK